MPPSPPKPVVRELADCRVLHYLRERQGQPCHVMQMLNALTKLDRPRNRMERRRSFRWHLERLPILLREGVIRRCGRKHVILLARGQALPPTPSPVGPRRAEVEYAKRLAIEARLHALAVHRREPQPELAAVANEPISESDECALHPVPPEQAPVVAEPSLTPDDLLEAVHLSAVALARLPRKPKRKWSGWIDDRNRIWRGRHIVTPEGDVMGAAIAHRGRVLAYHLADEVPHGVRPFRALTVDQVQLWRNPAAIVLGSRKAGVRERPSAVKQATARRNGAMPCRPGKRRGRPRGKPDLSMNRSR